MERRRSSVTESGSVVSLNVGGTLFTTYKATLLQHPDSMLAALISGPQSSAVYNGATFIDRDAQVKVALPLGGGAVYGATCMPETMHAQGIRDIGAGGMNCMARAPMALSRTDCLHADSITLCWKRVALSGARCEGSLAA